jgi:hypothetical protein
LFEALRDSIVLAILAPIPDTDSNILKISRSDFSTKPNNV